MKHLADMSDEELAVSYMEGNNRAFDLLLEHNQSKLFSYILFIVRDEDVANDVFQETFIKIIVKLRHRKYAPTGKFAAWCMRIAHNIIMDQFRQLKSERIIEPTENNDLSNLTHDDLLDSNIETRFINDQVMKDIQKMIDLLPPSQREVVFMRFFQQMSFKEIAKTTEVSINTALGRMRYAILNMRKMARDNNVELQLY